MYSNFNYQGKKYRKISVKQSGRKANRKDSYQKRDNKEFTLDNVLYRLVQVLNGEYQLSSWKGHSVIDCWYFREYARAIDFIDQLKEFSHQIQGL